MAVRVAIAGLPRLVGVDGGYAVWEAETERAARRLCEAHAGPGASWTWTSASLRCGDMARYFDEVRDGTRVWRVVLRPWPDPRDSHDG